MDDQEPSELDRLKAKLKAEVLEELKDELKKEVIEELQQEINKNSSNSSQTSQKNFSFSEMSSDLQEELTVKTQKMPKEKTEKPGKPGKPEKLENSVANKEQEIPDPNRSKTKEKQKEIIQITVKAFLKIASHAKKYANDQISQKRWVEVIGLLAGKYTKNKTVLTIEDVYPMGHGTTVYAEIKDYANFDRAFRELRSKGLFICGWYHSHPTYGLFLSGEDMGTQARYQKFWKKSLALVIDPYQIDGTSFGFQIFRANLRTQKWYPVEFSMKGEISPTVLPDLLKFINPIIDGKALFLEYDSDSTFNG